MASFRISIENDTALSRFRHALNRAGMVAGDMIEVKTKSNMGAFSRSSSAIAPAPSRSSARLVSTGDRYD